MLGQQLDRDGECGECIGHDGPVGHVAADDAGGDGLGDLAGAHDIARGTPDADQKLKMAEQAVQIAQNRADAEAAPLNEMAKILEAMHAEGGKPALDAYLANASLPLREKAAQTIVPGIGN